MNNDKDIARQTDTWKTAAAFVGTRYSGREENSQDEWDEYGEVGLSSSVFHDRPREGADDWS